MHGLLPAVLLLEGSPVGFGIRSNWGLTEMTESARNESQLVLQMRKVQNQMAAELRAFSCGRQKTGNMRERERERVHYLYLALEFTESNSNFNNYSCFVIHTFESSSNR